MKNRISVSEVAELMNVSEQFIRIGLQKGIFPFGYAVKMSTQWTYYIDLYDFTLMLDEYLQKYRENS